MGAINPNRQRLQRQGKSLELLNTQYGLLQESNKARKENAQAKDAVTSPYQPLR